MRRLWDWWKRVARRLGDLQARLVLALFYFTVLTPFALALRWLADPLAIKKRSPSGWRVKGSPSADPLRWAERQF